jgi:hypothetical protein
MRKYQLYIDGQFVDSASGETFQSINPATEEPIAEVARANREDARRAIAAARRAFDEGPWSRTTAADRAKVLHQIAEALTARAAELAALETEDSGGTIRKTMGDLTLGAMQIMTFAEMGAGFPYVENLPDQMIPGPAKNFVYREPFGVCGQIIPWNFPLVMAIWKLGRAGHGQHDRPEARARLPLHGHGAREDPRRDRSPEGRRQHPPGLRPRLRRGAAIESLRTRWPLRPRAVGRRIAAGERHVKKVTLSWSAPLPSSATTLISTGVRWRASAFFPGPA